MKKAVFLRNGLLAPFAYQPTFKSELEPESSLCQVWRRTEAMEEIKAMCRKAILPRFFSLSLKLGHWRTRSYHSGPNRASLLQEENG